MSWFKLFPLEKVSYPGSNVCDKELGEAVKYDDE